MGNFCSPLFRDCRFAGNTGDSGGGVYCGGYSYAAFLNCIFEENRASGPFALGGGLHCVYESDLRLEECVFSHNMADSGGGALYAYSVSQPRLTRCTLAGNAAPLGSGIYCRMVSMPWLFNCILAHGEEGAAVYSPDGVGPMLQCCDVYGNAGGDWTGVIADQFGQDGNICADPLLCDRPTGGLRLHVESPCLPGVNPECGLIGAWPVGCPAGGVDTDPAGSGIALQLHPNPASDEVRIDVRLPVASAGKHLRLVMLDSGGRVVRQLAAGPACPTEASVSWDRRDRAGRRVPAGLYFCRLQLGADTFLRKALIVR